MKNVIIGILGMGLLALGTGCGPSKLLTAAQDYEKAACACKDIACTTEASKKYADAAKEAGAAGSSEAEAITKATTAAAACVTKIATSSVPGMPAMPGKK